MNKPQDDIAIHQRIPIDWPTLADQILCIEPAVDIDIVIAEDEPFLTKGKYILRLVPQINQEDGPKTYLLSIRGAKNIIVFFDEDKQIHLLEGSSREESEEDTFAILQRIVKKCEKTATPKTESSLPPPAKEPIASIKKAARELLGDFFNHLKKLVN